MIRAEKAAKKREAESTADQAEQIRLLVDMFPPLTPAQRDTIARALRP